MLDDDDVVAHQHLVALLGRLHLFTAELLVLIRHDKHAVGRSCQNVAFVVCLDGSHFHKGIFRIAFQTVLRMQEHGLAILLGQYVHTAAVGCYPDIARLVLDGDIGRVVVQTLVVARLVAEVLDGPSAGAVRRHLE